MHAFKQIGPHYSFRPVRVQYRPGQAGGRNKSIGIPFCRTGADKSGGFPNKEGAILAKANILQRRTQQRAAFPPEFAAEVIPGLEQIFFQGVHMLAGLLCFTHLGRHGHAKKNAVAFGNDPAVKIS